MAIPRLIKYKTDSVVASWGTLFEDFETFSDWSKVSGDSIEANSINIREGVLSLKLNSVSGTAVIAQKTINQSFSAATSFVFWVYIYQLSTLTNCILRFSSTTDFSKYFTLTVAASSLKQGWNHITAAKAQFVDTGGEDWANTMIRMRVECTATGGNDTGVTFDDLRYDNLGAAYCILTFDDNSDTIYDNARPRMDTNGQAGVAFVVTNWVDTGGCMTKAEMTTLQNTSGWDISNHSKNHAHYASDISIDDAWQWLVDNGFSIGAQFYAYPYGEYNDAILTQVRERHRIARSTIDTHLQAHFNMNDDNIDLLVKGTQVGASTSPSTVEGWIDNTISQKGLLVLIFHAIVTSGASGNQYNKADFEQISDYLYSKAGQIVVIPLSYYYNQFMPSAQVIYLQHAAIVPYPIVQEPLQSVNQTEGGRLRVYSHSLDGLKRRIWQVKCQIDNSGSTGYTWDDLNDFYWDVIEGAKYRCVFIDVYSVQHLVRITSFQPRVITAGNNYEVTMILEEDSAQ